MNPSSVELEQRRQGNEGDKGLIDVVWQKERTGRVKHSAERGGGGREERLRMSAGWILKQDDKETDGRCWEMVMVEGEMKDGIVGRKAVEMRAGKIWVIQMSSTPSAEWVELVAGCCTDKRETQTVNLARTLLLFPVAISSPVETC